MKIKDHVVLARDTELASFNEFTDSSITLVKIRNGVKFSVALLLVKNSSILSS